MAGPTNQLGEAVITVRVDDTGVGPGMAMAEAKTKDAAARITSNFDGEAYTRRLNAETERAFHNAQRANAGEQTVFGAAGREAREAAPHVDTFMQNARNAKKDIGSFLGVAGLVTGTATAFYQLGKAINEGVVWAITTGTEHAKKFYDALSSTKPAEIVAELKKQLDGVNNSLAGALAVREKLYEPNLAALQDGYIRKLEEERDALTKLLQTEQASIAGGAKSARTAQAKSDAKQAASEWAAVDRERTSKQKNDGLDALNQQRDNTRKAVNEWLLANKDGLARINEEERQSLEEFELRRVDVKDAAYRQEYEKQRELEKQAITESFAYRRQLWELDNSMAARDYLDKQAAAERDLKRTQEEISRQIGDRTGMFAPLNDLIAEARNIGAIVETLKYGGREE